MGAFYSFYQAYATLLWWGLVVVVIAMFAWLVVIQVRLRRLGRQQT